METKQCIYCRCDKPLNSFGKSVVLKDGLNCYCRECIAIKKQQQKQKDPDGYRSYQSKFEKIYGRTPRGRYHKLKVNAKQGGVHFQINADSFVAWYQEQENKCYYCGQLLENENGWYSLKSPTIDRKDNNKGYTLDNIALCCRRCNLMKGSWLSERQTLEIAQKYFSCQASKTEEE